MFSTMISGSLISLMTLDWLVIWVGLEVNLIGFLMLSILLKSPSDMILKYFLIQATCSSMLFLMFILMQDFNMILNKSLVTVVTVILMLKMGIAPLHFWLPMISYKLKFHSLFYLLTWQKLVPLFMNFMMELKTLMIFFMVISALWGSMMGFIQTNINLLLVYSSISHSAWILTLISEKLKFWFIYWMIYSMNLFMVMYWSVNMSFIMKSNYVKVSKLNLLFILSLLSLGGFPPFLGFLLKWVSIINIKFYILIMLLLITSVINLYYYIRIVYSFMVIENMNFFKLNKNFFIFMFMMSTPSMMFMLLIN